MHGEGAFWLSDRGELGMVDLLEGDVMRLSTTGKVTYRRNVGPIAAAFRPRADGSIVLGVERGFAILDAHDELHTLAPAWDDPSVRMNDGACDRLGRFYCGSMAYDASAGRGSLLRLNSDGSTTTVLESVTISNGLAFDSDGTTAVYVDSFSQQVRRYRLPDDDGAWNESHIVAQIDERTGTPDGLCLDEEGGVWVALWMGSAVHRYDRSGVLTDIIELPVAKVTACTLGGADGRDLFITTSRLDEVDSTIAGAVFHARAAIPAQTQVPATASFTVEG